MKKIFSLILVLAMLMSLAACGTTNNGSEPTTTTATSSDVEPGTTTPPVTTTEEPTTATTTTTEPTTEVTTTTAPPEPEYPAAIKTAEDFAAMNPDGEYYLANDITIDATWNDGLAVSATYKENVPFTGILDGKGYTITTTVALFANLQGTVKDLTVAGELTATDTYNGAVAIWTNGTVTFENVTNKANLTGGSTVGGLLGYGATGTVATFTNCVNDGNITCTSQVGGMAGYIQDNSVVITNCVNNGNLTTDNYGAGIIGRFGRDAATAPDSICTITGCTNNGTVVSAKGQTGGILGYLVGAAVIKDCVNNGEVVNTTAIAGGIFGSPINKTTCTIEIDNCINKGTVKGVTLVGGIVGRQGRSAAYTDGAFRVTNCVNFGDVYATATAGLTGEMRVGGISGYAYGGNTVPNGVVNCINNGNIIVDSTNSTGTVNVGGIVGYVNSANFELMNNINTGDISCTGTTTTLALIVYNMNAEPTAVLNNYSVAVGEVAAILITETPVAAEVGGTVVTAEQLASGEVAYLLNKAAGEVVFYQTLGTDAVPTLVKTDSNTVYKANAGGYTNVAADGTLDLDTAAETSAAAQ